MRAVDKGRTVEGFSNSLCCWDFFGLIRWDNADAGRWFSDIVGCSVGFSEVKLRTGVAELTYSCIGLEEVDWCCGDCRWPRRVSVPDSMNPSEPSSITRSGV